MKGVSSLNKIIRFFGYERGSNVCLSVCAAQDCLEHFERDFVILTFFRQDFKDFAEFLFL